MVDEVFVDEYNSMKHGLRARPGDWHVAIGLEDESGTHPSAEQMHVLQAHPFGSNFLRAVPLKKHQMTIEEQRVNWTPSVLATRIPLIADSIDNVLTFLKWYNGAPPENLSVCPITESAAMEALAPLDTAARSRFTRNARLSPEMVPVVKREELLDFYLHAEKLSRDSEETS